MLNIFETGDESFRLSDRNDVDVGWIRGSALGFDGFETEADALAAAVAGSDALAAFLERLTGAILEPEKNRGRIRVKQEGTQEWVVRGTVSLARLYRPGASDVAGSRRQSFGVEFVLPSYVKPGAAISASQVVHRAIEARPVPTAGKAAKGAADRAASDAAAALVVGALAEPAAQSDGLSAR